MRISREELIGGFGGYFFYNLMNLMGKDFPSDFEGYKIGLISQLDHGQIEIVCADRTFPVKLMDAGGSANLQRELPSPLRRDKAFRVVAIHPKYKNKDKLYEGNFIFIGKTWLNRRSCEFSVEWYK